MKRTIALALILGIAIALLFGLGTIASTSRLVAAEFQSSGDEIAGWYWLRDEGLQQTAEWTFVEITTGSDSLVLEFSVLATDHAGGGRGFPARFRLIYGYPGTGMMTGVFKTQVITLPNVSSPDDPLGYACRGTATVSRSPFPAATSLVFRVERISPTDSHVAFNKESLAILSPAEAALELVTAPVRPSDFACTGDYISGIGWCRRVGHALEWTWGPLSEGNAPVEAAVNFTLLVTNTFDGGSGFAAVIPATVFDLEGEVVELGLLDLSNTFRPKFAGDSGGIGYAATGAYELKNPDLVTKGFRLRLAWPAIASPDDEVSSGDTRHFGGNATSALLAYVAVQLAEGAEE